MDASIAWTEDEDRLLIASLAKLGNVHWKSIATGVPGRTGSECRDRFHKTIKKSAKYRDIIPDSVLNGRRRPVPVSVPTPPVDATIEDADLLALDLPLDFDDSAVDTFSFEGMLQLGALPHLAQPVPLSIPSPSSLAALPQFQVQAPAPPGRKPGLTISMVPTMRSAGQATASMTRATAGPIGFAPSTLSAINKMINRPLGAAPVAKPIKKRAASKAVASVASTLVFNPQLVRSIA